MGDSLMRIVVFATVVLTVTGCSEARSGTPMPTGDTVTRSSAEPKPSTPPSSTGSENRYGAPKVDNPLDATKYLTDPCSAISPRLLQSLGLPGQGKPDTDGAIGSRAPSCGWRAGRELVSVGFLKGNENGLADLYRGHASQPYAFWEETTIEGYPGVIHDALDSRDSGECSVAVGLNDALAMAVHELGGSGPGPCERAKTVAEAAIQTLRGQG